MTWRDRAVLFVVVAVGAFFGSYAVLIAAGYVGRIVYEMGRLS